MTAQPWAAYGATRPSCDEAGEKRGEAMLIYDSQCGATTHRDHRRDGASCIAHTGQTSVGKRSGCELMSHFSLACRSV